MSYFRWFLAVSLVTGLAVAETIRVPEDYPTARLALEAAANGDTVLISGGSVSRNVYFNGNDVVLIGQSLLGNDFRNFANRITSLPTAERGAVVDSFMSAVPGFPFAEADVFCYFIYRGSTNSVAVAGDFNGWNPTNANLSRLADTNFWYREYVFEADARLDYKLVLNGSQWILDPRNPNTVSGGFGPNSELAMPDYVQPTEIAANPAIAHGSVFDTTITSAILGNSRPIRIYTPPGYAAATTDSFPMILFHDGLEYLALANVKNIFDNLIDQQRIQSLIGVFVHPIDRNNELGFTKRLQYEAFIIDELMPLVTSRYRIKSDPAARAMTGPSLGGLITTQICYNHPDVFGLAAPFSPSYWANDRVVFNEVVNGPVQPLKFYLDWGTYEPSIMMDGRLMRDYLDTAGYEMTWQEWHEGHSWGSWRAHVDNALEFFFPGSALGTGQPAEIAEGFELFQNYPNPFNPETTIRFQLPFPADISLKIFDLLGREVVTLKSGFAAQGEHTVVWNGQNTNGETVGSGFYFYRLVSQKFSETRRMLLIR